MISGMILSIDDYIFQKKTFAIDYNQDLPGPSSIPRKEYKNSLFFRRRWVNFIFLK